MLLLKKRKSFFVRAVYSLVLVRERKPRTAAIEALPQKTGPG